MRQRITSRDRHSIGPRGRHSRVQTCRVFDETTSSHIELHEQWPPKEMKQSRVRRYGKNEKDESNEAKGGLISRIHSKIRPRGIAWLLGKSCQGNEPYHMLCVPDWGVR